LRGPAVERNHERLARGFDDPEQPMPPAAADHQAGRMRLPVPPVRLELDDVDIGEVRDGVFQPGSGQRVAQVERQRVIGLGRRHGHATDHERPGPRAE